MNGRVSMLFVVLAAFAGLFASGCSSVSDNLQADIIPPQFTLTQMGGVGAAAEHVSGGVPVKYRVTIANPSSETITLTRLSLSSVGAGAYELQPTNLPFNLVVDPNHEGAVDFWAPTIASDTITGVNGPVTVRTIAYFKTEMGQFQKVYVGQVNDSMSRKPPQQ